MATKRLSSIYTFYQRYYGRKSNATDNQRINYGRAIGFTERVINQCFQYKSLIPIHDYKNQDRKHPLTVGFLEGFLDFAVEKEDFFERYERSENQITIETPGFTYNKLTISIAYLSDLIDSKLIILTYGKSSYPQDEFSILNTLIENYQVRNPISEIDVYEYWDLTSKEEVDLRVHSILKGSLNLKAVDDLQPTIINLVSD